MLPHFVAAFMALSLRTGALAMRPIGQTGNSTTGNDTTVVDPMDACRLRAHVDVPLSAGWEPMWNCVESTGTIQGFMIFVDFPDAEAGNTTANDVHDALMPKAGEWLQTSSYGQLSLNITADTSKFYRMPTQTTGYNWTFTDEDSQGKYIEDALDAYLEADSSHSRTVPVVDVLYIVAPPAAEALWNSLAASFSPKTASGRRVATKTITMGMDIYQKDGHKTLAHETGHSMCLPDYYPGDRMNPLGYYVADFSIMGDSTGQAPDHFAWDKWRMGWLPDTAVDCVTEKGSTTHVLTALEATPGRDAQAVVVATSDTRALVAEVRAKDGVDDGLCADASGVLLYTVNTRVPSGQGPIRILDNAPSRWTCGGNPANRAALSFGEGRSSSLTADEFGVTVTLVDEASGRYTIKVDYK